jgi:hypothetical protein
MLTPNIKVLVIIIGQEVTSIKPYTTNSSAPIEFMIRKVLMFFIKNEIIKTNEAK